MKKIKTEAYTPTPEWYIETGAILTTAGDLWPIRSPRAEEIFRAVNAYDEDQRKIETLLRLTKDYHEREVSKWMEGQHSPTCGVCKKIAQAEARS